LIYYPPVESQELIENDYTAVKLQENIDCRYYAFKDTKKAVIHVGGEEYKQSYHY
jgi:hypothetical protein